MSRKENKKRLHQMVLAAVLMAILIVMSITPLGYLKVGPLEITFLTIPVAVGAVILGPWWGLFLGFVFGMTSVLQCVFGSTTSFFLALFEMNPFGLAFTCLVPRMLMGWLTGMIFRALAPLDKTRIWSFPAATFSAAVLNTVLFVSSLLAFFGRSDSILSIGDSLGKIIWTMVGVNGLVEMAVCCVVGGALGKALSGFVPPEAYDKD
ncbi:MAG: ECF transporter S component [Clostridia bacterium]|nr:ECF transporter S component [Clostridia bacterium]